jgi:hypothetical protein
MTHAWLFTGPPGSGRSNAALAFAAALQCERGGCGQCHSCTTARAGSHPDITVITTEGLTIGVDGRLKRIAAEGETLPGPVPAIGNSLSRVRFGLGVREFLNAWCALAPTHHVALGRGHCIAEFRKVATLLGLPFETVA